MVVLSQAQCLKTENCHWKQLSHLFHLLATVFFSLFLLIPFSFCKVEATPAAGLTFLGHFKNTSFTKHQTKMYKQCNTSDLLQWYKNTDIAVYLWSLQGGIMQSFLICCVNKTNQQRDHWVLACTTEWNMNNKMYLSYFHIWQDWIFVCHFCHSTLIWEASYLCHPFSHSLSLQGCLAVKIVGKALGWKSISSIILSFRDQGIFLEHLPKSDMFDSFSSPLLQVLHTPSFWCWSQSPEERKKSRRTTSVVSQKGDFRKIWTKKGRNITS